MFMNIYELRISGQLPTSSWSCPDSSDIRADIFPVIKHHELQIILQVITSKEKIQAIARLGTPLSELFIFIMSVLDSIILSKNVQNISTIL